MDKNKKLLAVVSVLIICSISVYFSRSTKGGEKSYKVRPEITLPEYRTDTARAIDAYERLMDRFMGLTERNLTGINTDVKDIAKKLVLIDSKLTDLSTRMARIEGALGIEQTEKRVEKAPEVKMPDVTDTNKPSLEGQK